MALINKLTAIADAIRTKTGESAQLSLDDMATAIEGISTGGGEAEPVDVVLNVKAYTASTSGGELGNLFNSKMGVPTDNIKSITINGIYDGNTSFSLNRLFTGLDRNIPFTFNVPNVARYQTLVKFDCAYMFENSDITENFTMTFTKPDSYSGADGPSTISGIFKNCKKLKRIPPSIETFLITGKSQVNLINLMPYESFTNCYLLDTQPYLFSDLLQGATFSNNFSYNLNTYNGTLLNTIKIPAMYQSNSSKSIQYTLGGNGGGYGLTEVPALQHLYFLSFDYTNTNYYLSIIYGAATFSKIGWTNNSEQIAALRAEYPDKEITDATSYALLKNDSKAWTANQTYSRYNHDSAVETINSLPDLTKNNRTSGTGALSASIFFKAGDNNSSAVGYNTDGGSLWALTNAEIAVATDKGWTIGLNTSL